MYRKYNTRGTLHGNRPFPSRHSGGDGKTDGTPAGFDIDQALDRALRVFWRKGYEGTTLPDLTAAMGINRPSLYAAFGNKEALFRKALEGYAAGPVSHVLEALTESTARAVVERLFHSAIKMLTDPGNPRGCLSVQGALACGDANESVRRRLAALRTAGETAIRKRFERARAEGDLPADSQPADLARYVATVTQGMAVQAAAERAARNCDESRSACEAWPK